MADNITRTEGDSTAPTGMIGSMQGTPSTSASTPGSMSVDMSGTVAGLVEKGVGIAMGIAEIGTGVPGGTAAISGAVTDTVRGKAPEDIAGRAVTTVGKSATNQALSKAGVLSPISGYMISTGMNMIDEAQLDNPNLGRAAMKSAPQALGALAGFLAFGPVGGFVGGILGEMFGAESIADGRLGDYADMRSYEKMRDTLEGPNNNDMTRGDTAAMAQERGNMEMAPGGAFSPTAGTDASVAPSQIDHAKRGYYDSLDTVGQTHTEQTANNPHEQNNTNASSMAEQTANNPNEQNNGLGGVTGDGDDEEGDGDDEEGDGLGGVTGDGDDEEGDGENNW